MLDLFLKTWQQRAVARIIIGIGAMIAGIAFASWFVRNSPPLDLAPRFFLYMWFGIGLGGGALFFFVGLYHVAKSLKAFRGNSLERERIAADYDALLSGGEFTHDPHLRGQNYWKKAAVGFFFIGSISTLLGGVGSLVMGFSLLSAIKRLSEGTAGQHSNMLYDTGLSTVFLVVSLSFLGMGLYFLIAMVLGVFNVGNWREKLQNAHFSNGVFDDF
ncbi:hypothetical protein FYJ63_02155 [Mobiluncus holmesii]|uniref:Uncharacterized protein n=2 Tax=Mobiluncus porci TaxID=2652278 RepID=A0A7K0K0V4_9ACTO|nr:hypothetical protein [Mobiluncus porci]